MLNKRATYTPWKPSHLVFIPNTMDIFWNMRVKVIMPTPDQFDNMVARSIFVTYKSITKAMEESI